MEFIPKSIKDLGSAAFTKVANKFLDFIITKYTGKSIKVFEAEGDIEADKVRTRWELLEKPFWLQAEAVKMGRQYTNFGNTLLKAAPMIISPENNISEDNDVFWGLLEHSKEISNDEMQELIAKILAGEYNQPGTYSMATLQVVKMLGKKELELFEKMGSLLINDVQIPRKVFSVQRDILKKLEIDFGSLQLLQSLSLFLSNTMSRIIDNPEKKLVSLIYFDKIINYAPISPEKISSLTIVLPGFYGLSPVGEQILKHLKPKCEEEYINWLKENYRIPNYKRIE